MLWFYNNIVTVVKTILWFGSLTALRNPIVLLYIIQSTKFFLSLDHRGYANDRNNFHVAEIDVLTNSMHLQTAYLLFEDIFFLL